MLILITYDINTIKPSGQKRLRKISKCCQNYGQRVQNSVFECDVDNASFIKLKNELLELFKEDEDSLRFYNLGNRYAARIEHYGVRESYDPEGLLMV